MSKRKPEHDPKNGDADESGQPPNHEGGEPSTPPDELPPSIPPRTSNEVLEIVNTVAATVSNCSDSEVKNFMATADFTLRELAVLMADKWPQICKTARAAGAESEKAAKVSLAVKIDINHTNILLMDTKVSLSFSEKHRVEAERQEDLTQVEFELRA